MEFSDCVTPCLLFHVSFGEVLIIRFTVFLKALEGNTGDAFRASSDLIRRHCHRHHVGSGSGQSRSRNFEPSLTLTTVFTRSVDRFSPLTLRLHTAWLSGWSR